MRLLGKVFSVCVAAIGTLLVTAPVQAQTQSQPPAQTTLAAVKKRGEVSCGVNGQLPGFSREIDGKWTGFEVDFCRAVAAAVLGDANKMRFVPVTTGGRFNDLREGRIDVLTRNTVDTLERSSGTGVRDAAVLYLDRQVVVASRDLKIDKLSGLNKGTICTLRNTPYGTALDDWFGERNLSVKIALYNDQASLYGALYQGTCKAVSQVMTPLASTIVLGGQARDYIVLPDLVALQPLAAFVRTGDDQWFDIVRWTFNALLHGEDLKLTRASVGADRTSANPEVRRLLGVEAGYGKLLGLDDTWAFNILSQVGNYAEIYDRNVGTKSPLGFSRGVNALWSNGGGIMFPMPLR